MLSPLEVEDLLLEHQFEWQIDSECVIDTNWEHWSDATYRSPHEVVGLGSVKVWDHDFGGIETNVSYLMFQVGDRIFRKEGLWVSHDGQYWDGYFQEVKPVQKVITDYEPVEE